MLSEMTDVYQKETGKHAWSSISGHDSENGLEVHAYIEGPTNEYMNWLEKRASENQGDSKNNVQQTHNAISAIEKALKIVDLWLPKEVSVEHEEEAKALASMHRAFLDVVQKQQ